MATNRLLAASPHGPHSDDEGNEDDCAGIYSFGQNTYGELALGDTNDRSRPTRVELGTSGDTYCVVDVACGNEQTVILHDNGDVFTCGYNDSGQCAIGTTDRVPTLRFSPGLSSNRPKRVFSGNGSEHVAALSENGNLYTVGLNMRGQLGLGTTTSVAEASLVKELIGRRVVEVACTYYHTTIVLDTGDLFACGCNNYGQLGIDGHSRQDVPRPIEYFLGRPVLAVACGQLYTVASLRNGGVIAFGQNDYGQLGLGYISEPVPPTRLTSPLDNAIVPQLSCGYHHTVIVTEGGAVYTFGCNVYGQLGLGHKQHMAKPTLVESLWRKRIVQVACGCYHTLALSDDGKVFPFGRNNHGQLGLETLMDCLSPQLISTLRNRTVVKVAAGFYHSVCLVGAPVNRYPTTINFGTLSGDLRRMLNNSMRSDITFVVEGRPFFAHSCILVARCEPLEKMLDGRMKECSRPEIFIPEFSYDVFAALMEFLYTDQVIALVSLDMTADFALELHALADQYLVTGLRRYSAHSDALLWRRTLTTHAMGSTYFDLFILASACESALLQILSVENVLIIVESAHFRNAYTLKKRCLGCIMDQFAQIFATEAFVALPQELLQEILLLASYQGISISN